MLKGHFRVTLTSLKTSRGEQPLMLRVFSLHSCMYDKIKLISV